MELAMVGLGRMGGNMARRLLRGGHRVVVWNRTFAKAQELESEGAEAVERLEDVAGKLTAPRAIWLMLPYGAPTDEAIDALVPHLRARRHRDRRRQLALPARRRARRPPRGPGAPLPRRRHERRRVGARGRLLPDGRRRPQRLRADRARPRHPGAARPRLRVLRRPRRRALREDGPQRHRVRHDAGLRRGLRAARRRAATTSTCRRSPTSGTRAAWCARGCSSWPSTPSARTPASRRSPATSRTPARAAGRCSRRSSTVCPCR